LVTRTPRVNLPSGEVDARMLKGLACLLMGAALVGGYSYYHNRPSAPKAQTTEQAEETEAKPDAQDSSKTVAVVGALAQWLQNAKPEQSPEDRPARKPHPSDHIAPISGRHQHRHREQDVRYVSPRKVFFRNSTARCQPSTARNLSFVCAAGRDSIQRRKRGRRSSLDEWGAIRRLSPWPTRRHVFTPWTLPMIRT
jgi:hypothetical protein